MLSIFVTSDLTFLPPYPPTHEEILEEEQQHHHFPVGERNTTPRHPPVGERKPTPRHPPLIKAASVIRQSEHFHHLHGSLQKSASLGYCPDFLDSDIDAFIDKLTVPPPPSEEDEDRETRSSFPSADDSVYEQTDRLAQSWDGAMVSSVDTDCEGLEFDNVHMSRTIDLGELALDDQYSALVIPPPPEESTVIGNIAIVPPVSSVTVSDKRKKEYKPSSSSGYNSETFQIF